MDIRLNHRNNGYDDDDDDDDDDDVDDDVILALRGEVEVDPRRGACHGLARGGRQRQAPAEETLPTPLDAGGSDAHGAGIRRGKCLEFVFPGQEIHGEFTMKIDVAIMKIPWM